MTTKKNVFLNFQSTFITSKILGSDFASEDYVDFKEFEENFRKHHYFKEEIFYFCVYYIKLNNLFDISESYSTIYDFELINFKLEENDDIENRRVIFEIELSENIVLNEKINTNHYCEIKHKM